MKNVNGDLDFDAALARTLAAIDIGPHCSCAEISMEILADALRLDCPRARCAAAGFGGGIGGSGGPCGAFSAGLIAIGMFFGERLQPQGCIAEAVEKVVQTYHDDWMEAFGSIMCSRLSGFPELRSDEARDAFFSGGGPETCTNRYIRSATEQTMRLLGPFRDG